MEEPKGIDKRSRQYRAYKEWKKNFDSEQANKPKGLGDVVKSITKATGIDKLVDIWNGGQDCGCDKRQEILNNAFPFSRPKCLDEREFIWLDNLFKTRKTRFTWVQIERLNEIYNRVFGTRLVPSTCSSCIKRVVKQLKTIHRTYE